MHHTICSRAVVLVVALYCGVLFLSSICSGEPFITANQIEEYLTKKSSPISGNGTVFVENGLKWNVDPRLIVAIAGAETTFGKFLCTDFNAWNWFYQGPCPNSPFASWGKGIATVSKFMRLSYLNKGYTTIPLIGSKYCAEGCENWVPLVTQFYHNELGGDTSALTFSLSPPPPEPAFIGVAQSQSVAVRNIVNPSESPAGEVPDASKFIGTAQSRVMALLNAVDPSQPSAGVIPDASQFVGNTQSQIVAVLNTVNPSKPPDGQVPDASQFVGNAQSEVISILNTIDPSQPAAGETPDASKFIDTAQSQVVTIVNAVDPSVPPEGEIPDETQFIGEAQSPPFSVKNLAGQ